MLLFVKMFFSTATAEEVNNLKQLEQVKLQFKANAQKKIQLFASELKTSLSNAIQTGGFEEGVTACKEIAPLLAQKHATTGWTIGRTSLRPRNLKNRPDSWEIATLNKFELDKAAGKEVATLEGFTAQREQNTVTLRYMKAIPVNGLCLSCHGENLSAEVNQKLAEHYPNDKAIGYKLGDIRGGFSLSQTIDLALLEDDSSL
tara:strand:- start:20921 stop:21526 length:606 start_codon:yes stop_codon:yes gene_type:complete